MIRAAIVGLGRWGRNIVASVQGASERLRFVRAVVRNAEGAREFAARHGLELSTRLEEALSDRTIEAVVLATPHSQHVEQILAASAAGKAVFCEKPLALTRADAERAVAACRRAGVALGVGVDKRFWPSMRELARALASGALGPVAHIEGHFSNENSVRFPSAWRERAEESPAGPMTATGIHVLDAFVHLLGPVRTLHAQHLRRDGRPDTISVLLEFESGASGVLASVRATPFYWRVHAFGASGSAEALGETELVLLSSGGEPRRLRFEPQNALRVELEAFADAVEGRAPYPATPGEMVGTIAALEAISRSIASGRPVAVSQGG